MRGETFTTERQVEETRNSDTLMRWLRHDPNCAVSVASEGAAHRWPVMLIDHGADHTICDCGLTDAVALPNRTEGES